jgi:hypothetical protein
MRLPLLLLVPCLLAAADPVALRADGTTAAAGEPIASGTAPSSFTLAAAPRAVFRLGAGSTASVTVDGAGRAVIDLSDGAIEADIDDRGPFPAILVRGAAMEVRVTGTLFVVQRVRRDADYVALIQGRVAVGLRQEVLALLGRDVPTLELTDRQGVGASSAGFDPVDTLSARPGLPAAGSASIRDQALLPDPDGATWGDGPGLPPAPEVIPPAVVTEQIIEPARPELPPGPEVVTSVLVTEQVIEQVVEQVGDQIQDQVADQVTQQVIDQVVVPSLPPLAGPPSPP